MKNVKRSLFTSVVSLLLCFVMLLGTTFAWFTDSAVSANNIITTGNLDVAMYWSENNTDWNNAEGLGARPVFDYDNWEPGYTEVRYIKVANEGNLSFKYLMYINPTGVVGALADVIDVSYDIVTGNDGFTAPTTMYNMGSLRKIGTLSEVISEEVEIPGGVLLPSGKSSDGCYSGEVVYCVAFHMQEEAGNEYMGKSIGDSFGINLHATQYTYESDSFGTGYDTNAEWPEKPVYDSGIGKLENSAVVYGALTREVTISGNNISATIPADVKIEDDVDSLGLAVNSVEVDGNLSLKEGESARSYDVHISGISADNTKPMIVNLGALLPAGIDATELKLYHTENGTPVQMTRVASIADFAIHNQYVYNSETGEVSIYVASFSTFSMVKTVASTWEDDTVANTEWYGDGSADEFTLSSVSDFLGFRDLVDEGTTFEGKTVKLTTDIDLADNLFNPIGGGWAYNGGKTFNGTFDGVNHTIYNIYVNGWELDATGDKHSSTSMGAGLFSSIHNATIKNLAIVGADMRVETTSIGVVVGCAQGECTFENIVVSDAILGNYQMRNGGIVGDIHVAEGDRDNITGDYSHTFKNIVVDSTVKLCSMWGDFDTGNGGVIGGKYGSSTVLMQDVIVAAELDVFSDVTAAYQWYAYRRCGMLIGYTGQNSPKQATNAAADFLTCENVKVYYGDWVNYTYYQFANQTDAEGNRLWNSNYPWVRAQESSYNGAFSNVRYGNPVINGEKINTPELAEKHKTGFADITFNQLYGGGQGVYGCAEHNGVTTNSKDSQTIYVHNNSGWTNLKLQYWFANGDDTWTTIIDGIDMSTMLVEGNVYKIQLPATVSTFKIVADGGNATEGIDISTLNNNDNYCLGSHGSTETVVETNDVATCTTAGSYDNVGYCADCGTEVSRETVTVNALGHDWKTDPYNCSRCDLPAETKTVYFYNNKSWNKVSIYYWSKDASGEIWYINEFPGVNMTKHAKDGTYDIYKFEIPAYAYGFVFSNGTQTTEAGHEQSVDINVANVVSGTIYWMLQDKDNEKYKVGSSTYEEGTKTIYFLNNWAWSNPQYSYMGIYRDMKYVKQEGTYKTYSITLPKFVNDLKVNLQLGEESEKIASVTDGTTYCMLYNDANGTKNMVECVKLYLKPNSNWTQSSAWFTARIWNNSGDAWFKMNKDGDYYWCYVPQGYSNVIFCRMNSANTTKYDWDNVWNQTNDLTFSATSNCYTIANGAWSNGSGTWSKK